MNKKISQEKVRNEYSMNGFEEKVFEGGENELKLYYCGKRIRNLMHQYGPYDQDRYLLYYIKEGKANLTIEDRTIELSAKGFFVNFPNSSTIYRCVEGVPWSIKWIVVDGTIIERYLQLLGITRECPFVRLNDNHDIEMVFDEMYELFDHGSVASQLYCISLVHKLFSFLAAELDQHLVQNSYVLQAKALMERHFSDAGFNVTRLSEMLGLHYNYFSILYKKNTGESPKKALIDQRLRNACKMLKFTDKPIKEVAADSGFLDEMYFSKVFRERFHVPPTVYRQQEGVW